MKGRGSVSNAGTKVQQQRKATNFTMLIKGKLKTQFYRFSIIHADLTIQISSFLLILFMYLRTVLGPTLQYLAAVVNKIKCLLYIELKHK